MKTDVARRADRLKERPTGRDAAYYQRFRLYDLERLAWEFLRRGAAFQVDCTAVEAGQQEAKAIARKWSLYRFKHYRWDYRTHGAPRFLQTNVSYFPNLTSKPLEKALTIEPGQVLFLLDASYLCQFVQAEDAQIERLRRRLLKSAGHLHAATRAAHAKQIQLKEENYPECLQLLDLHHAKVPVEERKLLIPSLIQRLPSADAAVDHNNAKTRQQVNQRYYHLKNQAEKLAAGGYRELAVMGAARRKGLPDKSS